MVTLEALNALYGDCLLLRYPGSDGKEKFWIIDGGPRAASDLSGQTISVWREVLLPRIEDIKDEINIDLNKPLPIALGMVSHIDDDHIFGIMNLMQKLAAGDGDGPAKRSSSTGSGSIPSRESSDRSRPALRRTRNRRRCIDA